MKHGRRKSLRYLGPVDFKHCFATSLTVTHLHVLIFKFTQIETVVKQKMDASKWGFQAFPV